MSAAAMLFEILATASSPVDAKAKVEAESGLNNLHSAVVHVVSLFNFGHLPEHLQASSKRFAALAADLATETSNIETTVALRKLLEAKDAAVRATLLG